MMNPNSLNDERELDAWLTRTLQRRSDYIDDAGFTEGVMKRLPAQRARRLTAPLWVALGAIVVGLLALALIPAQDWAYALVAGLLTLPLATLIEAGLLTTSVLVVGAAYWIWQEN